MLPRTVLSGGCLATMLLVVGCGPPVYQIEFAGHYAASIEEIYGNRLLATYRSLRVGTTVEVVDRSSKYPGHWRVRPLDGDHKGEVVWVNADHVRTR